MYKYNKLLYAKMISEQISYRIWNKKLKVLEIKVFQKHFITQSFEIPRNIKH